MAAPIGVENDPDSRAIREIAEILVRTVRRDYPPGTLARRDAHPKHHGCVRAEFRIDQDVPADLRHGIFADVRAFPAWIRFSNGSPRAQPDSRRDQRGMAIKLMEVPGPKVLEDERDAPTQDFVLANYPRFFIKSISDYVEFARAAAKQPPFRVLGFFLGWNPIRWKLHELGALVSSLQHADSPLAMRYWSQTPYRLGPHAVKYSARPIASPADASQHVVNRTRADNFLRQAMIDHLKRQPAVFEFLIQRQADQTSTPIDDSTVEWPETIAPFRRVATITIPVQQFDSPEQLAFAEHISYTPWHTLPVHEPLGEINRTRRVAYQTISRLRHEMNGVPRREPHSLTIEPWWGGLAKD
jgi:catalase